MTSLIETQRKEKIQGLLDELRKENNTNSIYTMYDKTPIKELIDIGKYFLNNTSSISLDDLQKYFSLCSDLRMSTQLSIKTSIAINANKVNDATLAVHSFYKLFTEKYGVIEKAKEQIK